MLTKLQEKIPSTRGSEEDQTSNTESRRTVSPTHYQLSCSGPTSDFKTETPVATLLSAWCQKVSAGADRLCIRLDTSLISNFYPSVAAHAAVKADPSKKYTLCVAGMISYQQTILL